MQSVFFRFISGIYLKNFFIIFFGLLAFFLSVDLLVNLQNLPSAANLFLLYIVFLACSAIQYILPVALIFALVLSMISIIRSNEFVSFCALGLSKNLIILYPFLWALFFCFIYVALNFTPFAYASSYQKNIVNNAELMRQSDNVFIKYDDSYIYIKSLDPSKNEVLGMKIFSLKDLNISEVIDAKKANFQDSFWLLEDGLSISFPENLELLGKGLEVKEFKNLQALNDFKPKLIESVASKSTYTIMDALDSIIVLQKQGVNIWSVKTELYKLIFAPFFAPFLMLIIYYFFPITARFFNLAFLSFVFFIVVLGIWGLLFLLIRLSEGRVLLPEIGIILPVLLLALTALMSFRKHK
ncbi:hypothetical protein DMB92_07410 [Campylobacter sp. MIT 99-7217]|uniref:LptF/LptG family permease n=1 Tax=Campylobacter sp. MIT 99-7217 TaxID=535091 RepID=UPI001159F008|nr:LptF/LptG family permease [Campylobacter sp. MIT 99-7217]TQR30637.1 hypothetical protein DMB92_07410 [Campylobacter sp. MIT 99-7217]